MFDTTMIHMILIDGHALAGITALLAGCFVLRPPRSARTAGFRIYFYALLIMLALMGWVVGFDWMQLTIVERAVFSGLVGLGIYTVFRGYQARHALRRQPQGWESKYVGHVGFTLISLFDGFSIVSAIDLGAPAAIVACVAVAGVIAGVVAIRQVKRCTHAWAA